ncbi:MAG: ATP-binding protein [Candidatus Zixiibacteriota bacterium]
MTFTGKIRIYLILIALLPPLTVMAVIYFSSMQQVENSTYQNAYNDLNILIRLYETYEGDLRSKAEQYAVSSPMQKAVLLVKAGRLNEVKLAEKPVELDFMEIIDGTGKVLASSHRPGLTGNIVQDCFAGVRRPVYGFMETLEYDLNGRHAALVYLYPLDNNLLMYCGKYINENLLNVLGAVRTAEFTVLFKAGADSSQVDLGGMNKNELYEKDGRIYAILAGGGESGYYLISEYSGGGGAIVIASILKATGAVAAVSILAAIFLGIFITGRAKREIDNLVTATGRVAQGDFSTPVMAYEEGEFSQLADSISEMMIKLKRLQRELATTEKIAAWKSIGQKIAHEVKNPLTPIALSVDDLRRSYIEKLPDFEKTLMECTTTVREEVRRLTRLLDQFVSFARMNAPTISEVKAGQFIDSITALYQRNIERGQLRMVNKSRRQYFQFDPEAIKQVFLNTIKNSFESGPDIKVTITISDTVEGLEILIEDDGPGFAAHILERRFEPYLSGKKDGSGLGLIICQRIIHDHGGVIDIYNRPEGGAGVNIKIPFENGQNTNN